MITMRFEPKVTDRAFAVCAAGANIKAKEVTLRFELYDYNKVWGLRKRAKKKREQLASRLAAPWCFNFKILLC
jgi:hypothetical protein